MLLWLILAAIAVLVIMLLYFYAFIWEPINFVLSKKNIYIKTDNSKPFKKTEKPALKILHLSDFHLRKDKKGAKLFTFVRSLADINIDMLILTGDLVEKDEYVDYLTSMLYSFKARYGKYAIFGVHDYYNKKPSEFIGNMFRRKRVYKNKNDVKKLISKLKAIGIEVLSNKNTTINLKKSSIDKIEIIGIDDPILRKDDIKEAFKDIKVPLEMKVLDPPDYKEDYRDTFSIKEEKMHTLNIKDRLRLSLVHAPNSDIIIDMAKRDVDIVFSGHTHGGQVRIPKIGALITGCKLKAKFASGLFYFKKFVLHISRGLGEGRYSQFRFYCPPEATILSIYID